MVQWVGTAQVGLSKGQTVGDVGGKTIYRDPTSDITKPYIESTDIQTVGTQGGMRKVIVNGREFFVAPGDVPEIGSYRRETGFRNVGYISPQERIESNKIADEQLRQMAAERQRQAGLGEARRYPAFQLPGLPDYTNRYGRSNEYVRASEIVRQRQSRYTNPFTVHAENILNPSLLYGNIKVGLSSGQEKRKAEEELMIRRAGYYEGLKDTSPLATAKGISETLPAQAYLGGAAFKGGTLAARLGLGYMSKGAASTGFKRLANVLSFSSKAVEPGAVIGGIGYAGYDIHQTGEKEGTPGAAAKTATIAASLPFAYAGWKNAGQAWSRALTFGRKETPAPIIEPVLSGKSQFPETKAGTKMGDFLNSFRIGAKPKKTKIYESPFDFTGGDHGITVKRGISGMELVNRAAPFGSYGYHSTSETKGKEFTVGFPTTKTGKFQPGHKGDVPGLYISPEKYGTSPFFLRVGGKTKLRDYFNLKGLLQSEAISPTTMHVKLGGLNRLPAFARTDLNKAIKLLSPGGKAKTGFAYPTVALEKHLKVGGGKAEAEAVITPGTVLSRTSANKYYDYKGFRIALDEYAAAFKPGKITKTVKGKAEPENIYYRRSAIPTRTSGYNIYDSLRNYAAPSRYNIVGNRYAPVREKYTPVREKYTPGRSIYEAIRNLYTPYRTTGRTYGYGYTSTQPRGYTNTSPRPTITYPPIFKTPKIPKIRIAFEMPPIFRGRTQKEKIRSKTIRTRMLSLRDLFGK